MIDRSVIDAARVVDVRGLIQSDLGAPIIVYRDHSVFPCPFHRERTVGAFKVRSNYYHCFSCGAHGDAISWMMDYHGLQFGEAVDYLTEGKSRTSIEFAVRAAETAAAQLEQKIAEAQAALERLRSAKSWVTYHDKINTESRKLWHQRGISDSWINFWQLGYSDDFTLWRRSEDGQWIDWWHSPTLTIPIWSYGWDVANVKHRLLKTECEESKVPKYIQEYKGVPASPFLCDPDTNKGKLLILEGEIKAMVTYAFLDDPSMQIVGLPSCTPSQDMLSIFDNFDPIYMCLDPDAYVPRIDGTTAAERAASLLGESRVRLFMIPGMKIDDAIIGGHLSKKTLRRMIGMGRLL